MCRPSDVSVVYRVRVSVSRGVEHFHGAGLSEAVVVVLAKLEVNLPLAVQVIELVSPSHPFEMSEGLIECVERDAWLEVLVAAEVTDIVEAFGMVAHDA